MLIPVILSGGSGTRLWPLSREEYPKHLVPLIGAESLLQKTVLRLQGDLPCAAPIVVCNEAHRFTVAMQLQAIDQTPAAILLEPMGRNTAAAVALAALFAQAEGQDPLLLVLPADHIITHTQAFQRVVQEAIAVAEQGYLVTFGIVPTRPHTGYGYIRRGEPLAAGAYRVAEFVEKPALAIAEQYLQSQQYDWNSGMFLFRASSFLKALQQHAPAIRIACEQALLRAVHDLDFTRIDAEAFAQCPDISIDYAVMEKVDNAVVFPLNAGWSDVGSWQSLAEVSPQDSNHNVVQGDVLMDQVHNSYLRAESRLLAVLGLSNVVVVETADAVLVADKAHSENVKQIVKQLKLGDRDERLHHRTQYRPWGQHELLIEGSGFQVRRVRIEPLKSIRLQKHQHRSEHWVIVAGVADILCDGVRHTITQNQSFYVEQNHLHRIHNPSATDCLELVEVQVGECLREDDTDRVES